MFFDVLWLILGSIWYLYYYNNETTTISMATEASTIQANTTEIVISDEAITVKKLSFNQFQRIYLGKYQIFQSIRSSTNIPYFLL